VYTPLVTNEPDACGAALSADPEITPAIIATVTPIAIRLVMYTSHHLFYHSMVHVSSEPWPDQGDVYIVEMHA
jgi:hypothetical protein